MRTYLRIIYNIEIKINMLNKEFHKKKKQFLKILYFEEKISIKFGLCVQKKKPYEISISNDIILL